MDLKFMGTGFAVGSELVRVVITSGPDPVTARFETVQCVAVGYHGRAKWRATDTGKTYNLQPNPMRELGFRWFRDDAVAAFMVRKCYQLTGFLSAHDPTPDDVRHHLACAAAAKELLNDARRR